MSVWSEIKSVDPFSGHFCILPGLNSQHSLSAGPGSWWKVLVSALAWKGSGKNVWFLALWLSAQYPCIALWASWVVDLDKSPGGWQEAYCVMLEIIINMERIVRLRTFVQMLAHSALMLSASLRPQMSQFALCTRCPNVYFDINQIIFSPSSTLDSCVVLHLPDLMVNEGQTGSRW